MEILLDNCFLNNKINTKCNITKQIHGNSIFYIGDGGKSDYSCFALGVFKLKEYDMNSLFRKFLWYNDHDLGGEFCVENFLESNW